jgi:hypothetical protein
LPLALPHLRRPQQQERAGWPAIGSSLDLTTMPLGWKPKWASKLSRPIALPDGTKLHTLRDVRTFFISLPRTRHSPQWETAVTRLVAAAESGSAAAIEEATRAVWLALAYESDQSD